MPQVQFQSVKQKQIPVQKVQKKIEIPQLQLVQETMRSEIRSMTLENTFEERDTLSQAVVRIVNEASSVSGTKFKISSLSPRSSRQWRCRRKPIAANMRRSCRSEGDQQSEINLTRGKQQDCDSVEQQLSVQDPIGSKKQISDGIKEDREKPKKRRTSANPRLRW